MARVAGGASPVQVGGGYRSLELVEAALAAGAARVLVGTAALDDAFLASAVERFGAQIAVAIDARDGRVAVDGWTRGTETTPSTFASTAPPPASPASSSPRHAETERSPARTSIYSER